MSEGQKPSRVPAGKKRKVQQAIEYLIAHPKASTEEVMAAIDCSRRTVTNARAKGYDMGVLSRSPYDRKNRDPLAPTEVVDTEGVDNLMEEIARYTGTEGEPLDIDESKRALAAIARNKDNPDSLRIQAITASARLDTLSKEDDKLGPRPPLSRADWVDKMQVLLEVAGLEISLDAFFEAFDPPDQREFLTAATSRFNENLQKAENQPSEPENESNDPV